MRTTAAALTCCLLIVALTGATVVSGASSTPSPVASDSGVDLAPIQSGDTSNLTSPETIEIEIQSDGDARFVLSKEFPTASENQSAAFDRLAAEYENGEHGRLGYGTYVEIVDDVAATTGRSMELVENGPRTTRDGDDVGTLEYRFTWTNFATVNEANLTVGDAFHTGQGIWLGGLSSGQQLRIQAPEGYSVTESPSGPQIDDDALVWDGPVTFEEADLRATFEESTSTSTFGMTIVLGLVVALIVLTVLLFGWQVLSDRSDDDRSDDLLDRAGEFVAALPILGERPTRDEQPNGGTDHDSASSSANSGTTAVADAEPSPAADATEQSASQETETSNGDAEGESVDPELLSDEERVQQLLEENGGRMKQANIVTETGWSNAKVSQLLSRMDEEDRIDKLRIGRENLITLPDVDVTDPE
ncbi:helix-turn-helix transcriptional regulator [Salinarchaeum laminariae]|uniref:helix-turn-helix transcriptional regulator n=1 Tax=Salinarchaeum laminariae TaxID=869888 RepID=UPI0020C134BC|nr:hypothetical protein [Salinarchaeum laminariae]